MMERIRGCRSCGHDGLELVLDLGETPLADALRRPEDLQRPEPTYPLSVVVCSGCGLAQLRETVSPDELFCLDYPYYSSFSPVLLDHSRKNAEELIDARRLDERSLVVELASNDGYLLHFYQRRGIAVLGIDPAEGPARAARERGIPTREEFFGSELAVRLVAEGKRADVIHANNVLAHVPDLNGFVSGIATLLADGGVAVVECPHVQELLARCEFDTIYHEHLCYFSLHALRTLFARHGLRVRDVRSLSIHGGSLRLYLEREGDESAAVQEMLAREAEAGVDRVVAFRSFAKRVEELRSSLLELLLRLKAEGARIAAYGAAAKGATLLNYAGIGTDFLDFVVDRNVHKHGRFMPGAELPIHDPARLLEEQPDYTLLLAWNFRDEILEQQQEYRRRGGRFIVPVPVPEIV